jgi:hypothetical protein
MRVETRRGGNSRLFAWTLTPADFLARNLRDSTASVAMNGVAPLNKNVPAEKIHPFAFCSFFYKRLAAILDATFATGMMKVL